MERSNTMPRRLTFRNFFVDGDQRPNVMSRQTLVFRNEKPLDDVNKVIGTSFPQVKKGPENKIDTIFNKIKDLNYETYIKASDLEGDNLVNEIQYIGAMLANVAKNPVDPKSGCNDFHVNMMYFKGSGFFHDEKTKTLLLVPDSQNPEASQLINLTKIAKKFAEINNCFTIIIVEANLVNMKQY
jgi:hypothetical protein